MPIPVVGVRHKTNMRIDLEKAREYFPIATGAIFTLLMLQYGDNSPTDSFYVLWARETPFFVIGSIFGFLALPKRAMFAALFVLAGVATGVLLDVFVHPHDAKGYERNFFPIEIFAHTLFAAPSVLVVSASYKVISLIVFWHRANHENS